MKLYSTVKIYWILIISFFILFCTTLSFADFSYSIRNPQTAQAQSYIISKSNISLFVESGTVYWHPDVGADTKAASSPGVIVYHFPLKTPIAEAELYVRTDAFHWSYSQGHTFIYVSTDGKNWIKLSEALPPEHGGWTNGAYSGTLPGNFIGKKDIYVKIELYSYGSSAPKGGVWTNTAQHLRHDPAHNNITFQLEVKDTFSAGNASFNSSTSILHIPCLQVGSDYFWLDLFANNLDPLSFIFSDYGTTEKSAGCMVFDINNMTLNISNLFFFGNIYELTLLLNDNIFNYSRISQTGQYGEPGKCYVGCEQPNPVENMNCAVACDGFWGAEHALMSHDRPHIYFGPRSWDSCSEKMRQLGIPGW